MAAQFLTQLFDGFSSRTHGERYTRRIAPYKQPVLIYNPAAGRIRQDPERFIERSITALKGIGIVPQVFPTGGAGDATKLATRAVNAGADLVIALGGDGTINETANGLIPGRVPLAILPAGTANVLCKETGLGTNVERAVQRLASCSERRIAVGRVRGEGCARYFLAMAGGGLDAAVVTRVSPWWKAKTGKGAYWLAGTSQSFKPITQCDISANGRQGQFGFVLASRVRNYGGDLEIASTASLVRDDLEVVLFSGDNPIRYWMYMAAVLFGQVQTLPGVSTLAARRLTLGNDAPVQIDGEYIGKGPVTIESVPDALTLLIPPEYR